MSAELPQPVEPVRGFLTGEFWTSALRQATGAIVLNPVLRGVRETGEWLALDPTRPDSTRALGAHIWRMATEGADPALPATIASVASGAIVAADRGAHELPAADSVERAWRWFFDMATVTWPHATLMLMAHTHLPLPSQYDTVGNIISTLTGGIALAGIGRTVLGAFRLLRDVRDNYLRLQQERQAKQLQRRLAREAVDSDLRADLQHTVSKVARLRDKPYVPPNPDAGVPLFVSKHADRWKRPIEPTPPPSPYPVAMPDGATAHDIVNILEQRLANASGAGSRPRKAYGLGDDDLPLFLRKRR